MSKEIPDNIKVKTKTVTVKTFIAVDGREFEAEGGNDWQERRALYDCEAHNKKFDYLYFKVDETKLAVYNDENFIHFKWHFIRNYIRDVNQYGEKIVQDTDWMNALNKETFDEMVLKFYYRANRSNRYGDYVISPNAWKIDEFVEIMLRSGIVSEELLKATTRTDESVLFTYLNRASKIWAVKECVEKGYFKINAHDITTALDHYITHDFYFHKEDEYKLRGTKNKISTGYNKTEELKYYVRPAVKEYIDFLFSVCVDDKATIFNRLMYDSTHYIAGCYGGLATYYEYYHKLNPAKADKAAEKVYTYIYSMVYNDSKNKNAEPDDDFIQALFKSRINFRYDSYAGEISQKIFEDIKTFFEPEKWGELETFFYWATNGKANWADIHSILNKKELGYMWDYTYEDILKIANKSLKQIAENRERLHQIQIARQQLDEAEKQLMKR